jgi:poly-beta-1,6-N-acetyl-D-glucosamine N-deacetylase
VSPAPTGAWHAPDGGSRLGRRRFLTLITTVAACAVTTRWRPASTLSHSSASPAEASEPRQPITRSGLSRQVPVAARPLSRDRERMFADAAVRGFPAADGGHLLVLSYHDVTLDGRSSSRSVADGYTVRASDLAGQLRMLRLVGFRSVRLAEVLAARRLGLPLPPRSVLLTFDDARSGQWVFADQLLATEGVTATAFLITGRLGVDPGYLTWDEAGAMAGSGRWEVGHHTFLAHRKAPTGPFSGPASVLVNRLWDPAGGLEAFHTAIHRVAADVRQGTADLLAYGLGRPQGFAYPFSQVRRPTNDPAFADRVDQLLSETFPLRLTNSSLPLLASPRDLASGFVPRVEVRPGTSDVDLLDAVRLADQRAAARIDRWGPQRPGMRV